MKGKIVLGSIVAVLLMILVPVTNAIEIQTIDTGLTASAYTFDDIKNMDSDDLIVFIHGLAKDYPVLYDEFQASLNEMEKTPTSSLLSGYQGTLIASHDPQTQPISDNQTFVEKMFWRIFNYRAFRLYVSACIFIYHQSPLTLMRTMTWAMKLLRIVKIGVILGLIDPTPQEPQIPEIFFIQDDINNTLVVASVSMNDVVWSDIDEIGAGSCDPFPVGNITAGQQLTNCSGIIVLRYIPEDAILGVFEFD